MNKNSCNKIAGLADSKLLTTLVNNDKSIELWVRIFFLEFHSTPFKKLDQGLWCLISWNAFRNSIFDMVYGWALYLSDRSSCIGCCGYWFSCRVGHGWAQFTVDFIGPSHRGQPPCDIYGGENNTGFREGGGGSSYIKRPNNSWELDSLEWLLFMSVN